MLELLLVEMVILGWEPVQIIRLQVEAPLVVVLETQVLQEEMEEAEGFMEEPEGEEELL